MNEHRELVDLKGNILEKSTQREELSDQALSERKAELFRKKIWDICDETLDRVREESDVDKQWTMLSSIEKLMDISFDSYKLHT